MTTITLNLSSSNPVFDITLGDSAKFEVTTGAQAQPLPHKESHSTSGADRIRPEDIGAQGLFDQGSVTFNSTNPTSVALASSRAKIWQVNVYNTGAYSVVLPSVGVSVGDIVVVRTVNFSTGSTVDIKLQHNGYQTTARTFTATGRSVRYVASGTSGSSWVEEPVSVHSHTASEISDFTAAVTAIVNAIRPV